MPMTQRLEVRSIPEAIGIATMRLDMVDVDGLHEGLALCRTVGAPGLFPEHHGTETPHRMPPSGQVVPRSSEGTRTIAFLLPGVLGAWTPIGAIAAGR